MEDFFCVTANDGRRFNHVQRIQKMKEHIGNDQRRAQIETKCWANVMWRERDTPFMCIHMM